MEWSILFVLSCLLLAECGVSAGGRRMSRLENTVRDLVREIKELKTKSGSAQLAGATLDALQVESRALSQFDRQMRSLQDSLDQLARRKDRQVETSQSLRRDLDQLKWVHKRIVLVNHPDLKRSFLDWRKEFELKKSREVSGSDQNASSENVIKTVQWLTNSLTELRSEIDQINSNLNLTGYMQHSDDVNKQIGFITVFFIDKMYFLNQRSIVDHIWISGRSTSVASPMDGRKCRKATTRCWGSWNALGPEQFGWEAPAVPQGSRSPDHGGTN